MRTVLMTTVLLLGAASAQMTIFQIPALPPVSAQPAVSTPAPTTPAPTAAQAPIAQMPVAKVELQDVEVTAPASTGTTPTVASDDVGEVIVPVLATDKDGNPVAGVEVGWTVKNTGKAPLYVISSESAGASQNVAAILEPGATGTYTTVTGLDGLTSLLLNATASTAALIQPVTSLGEVKNLRSAVQSVDWLGTQ